jgi:hypothetical protein
MILTTSEVNFIYQTAVLCEKLAIDSLIIESHMIRAIDEAQKIAILFNGPVPITSFTSIGLNRISTFTNRFELFATPQNVSVTATIRETPDPTSYDPVKWVQSLMFKDKTVSVDYRCANPLTIQAPKALTNTVVGHSTLTSNLLTIIRNGQSAMRATTAVLKSTEDGLFLELSDMNRDRMKICIDSVMCDTDGVPVLFEHKYPLKSFLLPFKLSSSGDFEISSKGLLKTTVNNLPTYIIPE